MDKLIYILCFTIVGYIAAIIPSERIDIEMSIHFKYLDFTRYTFMHSHLMNKNDEKNYPVKKEEIEKKIASYTLLFPGAFIDTGLVKKEIIIEKHLLKTGNYYVSNDQIKNAYEEFIATLPKGTLPPAFDRVKPVFRSRALLKNEDVIARSNHERIIEERKIHEEIAALLETWPVEEIRINGRDEECIALLTDNDSCLLTIGDFNRALPFNTMSKRMNKDTVRIRLVRNVLFNKYLSYKARASDLDKNDDLMNDIEHWQEDVALIEEILKIGSPVIDEEILWETYKSNYHDLFKAYDKVTLEIIGSSDSLWIDSVSKLISRSIKTDTVNNSAAINKTKDNRKDPVRNLPWIKSDVSMLPEILIIPTDTLLEKGITSLVKTPFGYFICRVAKVERIKSLTYEEAKKQCIYIATRERTIRMDSLTDIKAFNYYKKNMDTYITPDIMILSTWLIPRRKTKQCVHSDTAAFKPLTVNSLSLPQEIRKKFTELVKSRNNSNSFYGPIESIYGVWYFKADTIINGGLQIPFHMVKHKIIDKIIKPHIKTAKPDSDTTLHKAKYEKQLAEAYIQHDTQKIRMLSDEEIHKLIEQGLIDTSEVLSDKRMSKEKIAFYAREKYLEQAHIEREENFIKWVASITIYKNRVLK